MANERLKTIWMIEVRELRANGRWSPWSATGRDWYATRRECKQSKMSDMDYLQYRVAKYVRAD